ncbi:MAG: hypothetical protein ACJ78R_11010 [Gemmatimonadaceae bacterium]
MRAYYVSLRWVARVALVLCVSTGFATIPASAQQAADGFSLGLAGGFARGPSSPFYSNSFGYYMQTDLEFPSVLRVFRPRIDGLLAEWDGGRIEALTANVLFTPIAGKRVAPYVLAGAGAYALSGVKAGWTLGAGLRLPGELRSITIESRVHSFLRGRQNPPPYDVGGRWRYLWTPIGLGIQF